MKKGRKIIAFICMLAVAVTMSPALSLMGASDVHAATVTKATKSTYWIKVNKKRNVATVYKKVNGKWTPFRAMLVSTGGSRTPSGTFHIGKKQRWGVLMDDVKGQYCTNITSDILFHSVWYYKYTRNSQSTAQFNKLGTVASHGCVRLACIDAKWIYDKCPAGTRVTIYSSSKLSKLGKPKALKSYSSTGMNWDPTDPASGNPNFKLRKPVITISKNKKTTIQYGSAYTVKSMKSGVKAKNTNANQDITSELSISKLQKYTDGAWKTVSTSKFSTKTTGTYKVTYYVYDKYCGKASKSYQFKVADTAKPTITASETRTAAAGETDALLNVTASIPSKDITSTLKVEIKEPDKDWSSEYTYAQAKEYIFRTAGQYIVKVKAVNPNNKSKKSEKYITVEVH